MKKYLFYIVIFILSYFIFGDLYSVIAIICTFILLLQILINSSAIFAFREWALFLYAVNYLFSPALTYRLDQTTLLYPMKIPQANYFEIAIPGFLFFYFGVYFFKTQIFTPSVAKIKRDAKKSEPLLIKFVIFGLVFNILKANLPGELAFLGYLISLLRYVGAFALLTVNPKKYWLLIVILLGLELYQGAFIGMYHDAVMWILFCALFLSYTLKPNLYFKLIGFACMVVFVLLIQAVKVQYREQVRENKSAGLDLILETTSDVSGDINSESNLLGSLNRGNQAWIFASTIDRMDRVGDFQGIQILGIYLEAALLPRFLAPNKITSGDKKIFNTFSGHTINENTSMGLGVFADGYIAFGYWGVMLFTFGLGLLFCFTFLIIESWAKISEFYILMVLPILNYAVRPDCELQTTINHMIKGLIVFGILVTLTKFNFVFGGRSGGKVNRNTMPLVQR